MAVSKSLLGLQQEDISQPFANSEIRRNRIDRQGAGWTAKEQVGQARRSLKKQGAMSFCSSQAV